MRILFCGTPSFAVPSLKYLLAQKDFEVVAVITQPDRPRGRGQEVSFSAVKEAAVAAGVRVFQPEKIRAPDAEQFLREAEPDAIVIIAYGQIIPARLLDIPRLGWINLHASLLPKYRGAAPIQWAIANGEVVTGVTSMRIDAGMDTGEIVLQRETDIGAGETAPELAQRLGELGAPLMAETLRGLRDGSVTARAQEHTAATLAPLLKKEDGRIHWQRSAQEIYNRMRGFAPWPGAFTSFRGTTCHIVGEPVSNSESPEWSGDAPSGVAKRPSLAPGEMRYDGRELLVGCGGESLLRISHVKMEGRKKVTAAEFANGAHVRARELFS